VFFILFFKIKFKEKQLFCAFSEIWKKIAKY
jgi:hypothetical protein